MNPPLNIRQIQVLPMITDWVLHSEIVVTSFIWIVFRDGCELGVCVPCVTRSGTLPRLSVSLVMGRGCEEAIRSYRIAVSPRAWTSTSQNSLVYSWRSYFSPRHNISIERAWVQVEINSNGYHTKDFICMKMIILFLYPLGDRDDGTKSDGFLSFIHGIPPYRWFHNPSVAVNLPGWIPFTVRPLMPPQLKPKS